MFLKQTESGLSNGKRGYLKCNFCNCYSHCKQFTRPKIYHTGIVGEKICFSCRQIVYTAKLTINLRANTPSSQNTLWTVSTNELRTLFFFKFLKPSPQEVYGVSCQVAWSNFKKYDSLYLDDLEMYPRREVSARLKSRSERKEKQWIFFLYSGRTKLSPALSNKRQC